MRVALVLAAVITAALSLTSIAIAQTAAASGPVVCRPAKPGETPNANIQGAAVVCEPQPAATPAPNVAPERRRVPVYGPYPYPGYNGDPND
jgi:hypothetical protein